MFHNYIFTKVLKIRAELFTEEVSEKVEDVADKQADSEPSDSDTDERGDQEKERRSVTWVYSAWFVGKYSREGVTCVNTSSNNTLTILGVTIVTHRRIK